VRLPPGLGRGRPVCEARARPRSCGGRSGARAGGCRPLTPLTPLAAQGRAPSDAAAAAAAGGGPAGRGRGLAGGRSLGGGAGGGGPGPSPSPSGSREPGCRGGGGSSPRAGAGTRLAERAGAAATDKGAARARAAALRLCHCPGKWLSIRRLSPPVVCASRSSVGSREAGRRKEWCFPPSLCIPASPRHEPPGPGKHQTSDFASGRLSRTGPTRPPSVTSSSAARARRFCPSIASLDAKVAARLSCGCV
jgi:hypothetical protein